MCKIQQVSESTGFSVEEILGKRKTTYLCAVRQCYMYHLRKVEKRGWSEIARMLNHNHATVIHGVRKVEGFVEVSDSLILNILKMECFCTNGLDNNSN